MLLLYGYLEKTDRGPSYVDKGDKHDIGVQIGRRQNTTAWFDQYSFDILIVIGHIAPQIGYPNHGILFQPC